MLTGGWLVDDLVLEDPSEVVGDEDGVEPCAESGIDIGAGAVADHPGIAGFAAVVGGQGEIGFVMFFGEYLDGGEVNSEAGAAELVGLLFGIAFGNHDEAMARGEVGERGIDAGKKFDLLLGDGLGEGFYAAVLLIGEGRVS